ncbi:MAG: synthase subunit a [Bacteroidota bacterium]|nr:synthase subunit a [Bacteroidota bacterium]
MANGFETNELAQNNQTTATEQTHSSTITQAHEGAHSGQEADASSVFTHLFSELGDHHGIILGPYHVADLPFIFVDDGFHLYANTNSVMKSGIYTMHSGHIVRKDNHQPPKWDLSPTNLIFFQWVAIVLLFVFFKIAGGRYKKNPTKAPKGIQNLIEAAFVFVRDEIVIPNVNGDHIARRLLPYFAGLFFFILTMNLLGLLPFGHTSTSTIGVTAALAITAYFVINFTAIREIGIGGWFKHLLGGAPIFLFPIMIPIEILSMFIKPFALTIRLFANMTAGHIVLLSLLGLLFYFQIIYIAPAIIGFSIFIYFLELLVCFIQAYIFTMLTAIFVGLAIGEHSHAKHQH